LALAEENVDGKYKIGERVEVDFRYNGEYRHGTVVEIIGKGDVMTCCGYRVAIDDDDPLWKDGRAYQAYSIRSLQAVSMPWGQSP